MKVQRHMALWLVPLAAVAIIILATVPWSETNAVSNSGATSSHFQPVGHSSQSSRAPRV